MSYLSATENVGFSGIPQNISDASCATQYKMAVEGASGNCSEVMYIPDNPVEESSYITHLNDNNFYTKFKIDPNELYTFHDSDVIAGEITVSHTEDTFMFPDNVEANPKVLDSPNNDLDILGAFTNGDVKREIKKKVLSNGHCSPVSKTVQKESNTKAQKTKVQVKVARRESVNEVRKLNAQTKVHIVTVPAPTSKSSINSGNTNIGKPTVANKQCGNETFLDVFKREQGLVENEEAVEKTEPQLPLPPLVKISTSPPRKSSGKTVSQPKVKRGRGPAVHEALQRISAQKAIPIPNTRWHAPGDNLFECGPLDNKILAFRALESSSSDEDNIPEFESGSGPVCAEESAAESRGARLALRRAALRRHVARAHDTLTLAADFKDQRTLASIIKKQLNSPSTSGHLSTQTVNHLLAMRGMPTVLNTQERRKLREVGWSGGESGSGGRGACGEPGCARAALPCARHCLAHVTSSTEQRLYAACAAVFAGGARCRAPLLPLREHTPLCAEHAWKRDNYDKLVKDSKPRRVVRAPRRAARRRRPPPRARRLAHPSAEQSLSEINVCSNSSAYDSAEESAMGALSEHEYIAVASHELEVEVGHVPADDILDPAVLNQIPDEAFTEFFNQGIVLADGEASFGEGAELAAVLEAVLDERRLVDRGMHDQHLDDTGMHEQDLDDTGVDEQDLDDTGVDEQDLEERELEDGIHDQDMEGIEIMEHGMVYHSTHAGVRGHMQVPPSAMEVSSSVTS